jgi:hypothetical protein
VHFAPWGNLERGQSTELAKVPECCMGRKSHQFLVDGKPFAKTEKPKPEAPKKG